MGHPRKKQTAQKKKTTVNKIWPCHSKLFNRVPPGPLVLRLKKPPFWESSPVQAVYKNSLSHTGVGPQNPVKTAGTKTHFCVIETHTHCPLCTPTIEPHGFGIKNCSPFGSHIDYPWYFPGGEPQAGARLAGWHKQAIPGSFDPGK